MCWYCHPTDENITVLSYTNKKERPILRYWEYRPFFVDACLDSYPLSFLISSVILFFALLLFLLLPLSLVSTLFYIFVEKLGYIPLAVEHHQRIILFSVSGLDTIGCGGILLWTERHSLGIQFSRFKVCALFFEGYIFAEGGFQLGRILFLLLFQLRKTSFCGSNVPFDRKATQAAFEPWSA